MEQGCLVSLPERHAEIVVHMSKCITYSQLFCMLCILYSVYICGIISYDISVMWCTMYTLCILCVVHTSCID